MRVINSVEQAFNFLSEKGFDVFYPYTHKGDCSSPYCVLSLGTTNNFDTHSTQSRVLDVLCYVPKHKYAQVLEYPKSVKQALLELEDTLMLRPTGFETPPYLDSTVNGYMVSIQYTLYEKGRSYNV